MTPSNEMPLKPCPKDALGQILKVGDRVIFMQIGYRSFMDGNIKSLAPKSALIEHKPTNTYSTESRQVFDQIILDTRASPDKVMIDRGELERVREAIKYARYDVVMDWLEAAMKGVG